MKFDQHSSQASAWQQARTLEDCEALIKANSKAMDLWLASHQPVIMMCPPDYFSVDKGSDASGEVAGNAFVKAGYDEYNKDPERNHAIMQTEWSAFRDLLLQKGAEVKLMQPDKRYPDQVFTADHAFSCAVFKREHDAVQLQQAVTILSRLAHPNRGGEMLVYAEFLQSLMQDADQAHLFEKWQIKESASYFEGIGDNVLDAYRGIIVSGFGLRNAETALHALQQITGIPVYGVMCKKPFFHIDTVFAPLPNGYVLYAPDVMHPESVAALEKALFKGHPELKKKYGIQVSKEDAYRFACNIITVGKSVIMEECSDELKTVLAEKGLDVTYTTAKIANYAGGGTHCMTNIFNQPVFV